MAIPIPSYQEIMGLIKKGATLEAQEKIMELREACVSFREESLALRERVKELEKKLAQKDKVVFERGMYWTNEEGARDGPYCPACYDSNDKLIRLKAVDRRTEHGSTTNFSCTICEFWHKG